MYYCIFKQFPSVPHIYNSQSQFWFLCCPCRQSQVSPGASVFLYGARRPRVEPWAMALAQRLSRDSPSHPLYCRDKYKHSCLHQQPLCLSLLLSLIFCSSLTLYSYSTQTDLHHACGHALSNCTSGVKGSMVEDAKRHLSSFYQYRYILPIKLREFVRRDMREM